MTVREEAERMALEISIAAGNSVDGQDNPFDLTYDFVAAVQVRIADALTPILAENQALKNKKITIGGGTWNGTAKGPNAIWSGGEQMTKSTQELEDARLYLQKRKYVIYDCRATARNTLAELERELAVIEATLKIFPICAKCEAIKLSEQPCPKCGSMKNAKEPSK